MSYTSMQEMSSEEIHHKIKQDMMEEKRLLLAEVNYSIKVKKSLMLN